MAELLVIAITDYVEEDNCFFSMAKACEWMIWAGESYHDRLMV